MAAMTEQELKDFDAKERWRSVSPQKVQITFRQLRMLVVASFEVSRVMESGNFTFSHRNIGNEYADLSRSLDELVIDLELRHNVIVIPEIVYNHELTQARAWAREEENKEIRRKLAVQLGCNEDWGIITTLLNTGVLALRELEQAATQRDQQNKKRRKR